MKLPRKVGRLATKAIGNLAYDMEMSEYGEDYRVVSLEESVELAEKEARW